MTVKKLQNCSAGGLCPSSVLPEIARGGRSTGTARAGSAAFRPLATRGVGCSAKQRTVSSSLETALKFVLPR